MNRIYVKLSIKTTLRKWTNKLDMERYEIRQEINKSPEVRKLYKQAQQAQGALDDAKERMENKHIKPIRMKLKLIEKRATALQRELAFSITPDEQKVVRAKIVKFIKDFEGE